VYVDKIIIFLFYWNLTFVIILPILRQMLTDFQNSFIDGVKSKFATKSSLTIPPHLERVAPLPYEISVFKKLARSRPEWRKLPCKTQPLKKVVEKIPHSHFSVI